MKKIILAVVLTACAINANSQDKKFRFGVKAGVNFAKFTGSDEDVKMKTGFHVGIVAEYAFTEHFSIQPELLYSAQGTKGDYTGDDGGEAFAGTVDDKFDYINLPILFKYNNLGVKGASVGFGPQIGYLLTAKEKYTENFDGETSSGEVGAKDMAKSIDYGLVFNLEYALDMGVFVQARYNLGLANVYNGDEDITYHNGVIQISVGYKF
jgi:hypothetical protein